MKTSRKIEIIDKFEEACTNMVKFLILVMSILGFTVYMGPLEFDVPLKYVGTLMQAWSDLEFRNIGLICLFVFTGFVVLLLISILSIIDDVFIRKAKSDSLIVISDVIIFSITTLVLIFTVNPAMIAVIFIIVAIIPAIIALGCRAWLASSPEFDPEESEIDPEEAEDDADEPIEGQISMYEVFEAQNSKSEEENDESEEKKYKVEEL